MKDEETVDHSRSHRGLSGDSGSYLVYFGKPGRDRRRRSKSRNLRMEGEGEDSGNPCGNEQGGYILRWENDEAEAEGMEDLPFDTKLADGIRDDLENMKTEKKVTDGKERLSDFGLITPKAQAEVIGENGKKLRFLSGMRYLIRKTRLDTSFGWIRYGRSKAAR